MTTKNNLGPHLTWLRQAKPQIPPPRTKPGNALLPPVATPASLAPPAPVQQPPSRRPPTTARERERRRGGGEEYEIQEEMPVLQLESSVSTRRPKLTSRLKGTTPQQQQQATPKATMGHDDRSYETPVPRTTARRENLTGGGYPTPVTSSNSTPSTPLISTETLTTQTPRLQTRLPSLPSQYLPLFVQSALLTP